MPYNKLLLTSLARYVHRGYYTAARRYDFYLRVVKTIFYERAQRVSKILFLTREDKSHIFKPPCNVLFIISSEDMENMSLCISQYLSLLYNKEKYRTSVFFTNLALRARSVQKILRSRYFSVQNLRSVNKKLI